jgi:hypothetical protein
LGFRCQLNVANRSSGRFELLENRRAELIYEESGITT